MRNELAAWEVVRIAPLVTRYLKYSNLTWPGFVERVRAGHLKLLIKPDYSTVVGLEVFDGAVHVTMYAGTLADLPTWDKAIVNEARALGLERITSRGRPGWRRVLAPFGYKPQGDELVKVVKNGIQ